MWLVGRTLLADLHLLSRLLHVWLIWVHGVALGWLRVLAWLPWLLWLLLLRRVLILPTALRQWLTVRAVQLSVRGWVLTAPDSVGRYEGLGLCTDGCEDTFLRETLTVGAATVLGLIEAGAADLHAHVNTTRRLLTRYGVAYLASSTISTRDCGPLAWSRLRLRVLHLRLVRRRVHLGRRRQRAILVGMLRLKRLHRGGLLRQRLRDGRDLFRRAGVSNLRGERRVDGGAHVGGGVEGEGGRMLWRSKVQV